LVAQMLFTKDDEEIKGEKYDKYAKVDPTLITY
jgi:hypothetical protein